MSKKIKYYCGDGEILPDGYDAFGSRSICLRKGFGSALYNATDDQIQKARARKKKQPLTVTELEKIAQHLGIPRGNKTKAQLIRAIITRLNKTKID